KAHAGFMSLAHAFVNVARMSLRAQGYARHQAGNASAKDRYIHPLLLNLNSHREGRLIFSAATHGKGKSLVNLILQTGLLRVNIPLITVVHSPSAFSDRGIWRQSACYRRQTTPRHR